MENIPTETVFEKFDEKVSGGMKCPSGNLYHHLTPVSKVYNTSYSSGNLEL